MVSFFLWRFPKPERDNDGNSSVEWALIITPGHVLFKSKVFVFVFSWVPFSCPSIVFSLLWIVKNRSFSSNNCQTWIKLRFIRDIKKILYKVGIEHMSKKKKNILIKVWEKGEKVSKGFNPKGKWFAEWEKLKQKRKKREC